MKDRQDKMKKFFHDMYKNIEINNVTEADKKKLLEYFRNDPEAMFVARFIGSEAHGFIHDEIEKQVKNLLEKYFESTKRAVLFVADKAVSESIKMHEKSALHKK